MSTLPLPPLAELAAQLADGRTTALALTQAALARAEDPAGEGARVFVALDREGALAQARASDARRQAGQPCSPLDGVPVSVKDLFDVAGQVTRAGSRVLDDAPPAAADAPAVARLRAAGAVLIGRTNMTEFAFSGLGLNPHFGTPRNPWDRALGRIPGGSSSGAAVSVSDGMAAAAVGSDTGGSVRIPSALCGLTGFKPTQRRVPIDGTVPLSTSLDSVGPLARSVACCALLDAVLAGESPQPLPAVDLRSLHLLVPTTVVLDGMDEQVSAAFARALALLRQAGARVTEAPLPALAELAGLHAKGTLAGAEAFAWHRALLQDRAAAYDPRVRVRIEAGAAMSAADYLALQAARRRWIAQVNAQIAPFDAVLMPTVPVVAPTIAELQGDDALYGRTNLLMLRNPTCFNFLDGCALSLPCQAPDHAAPVGLMVGAAGGQDARVLAIGQAIEGALATAARG